MLMFRFLTFSVESGSGKKVQVRIRIQIRITGCYLFATVPFLSSFYSTFLFVFN